MAIIRTVFFPALPIQPMKDDKDKLRARTNEDLAKEFDLFLCENAIIRDQIITIQFLRSDYGGHPSAYNIMLVYEMKEGKP